VIESAAMNPTPPSLDIVTVTIAVTTWMVGAEVAAVIGPYAVILLSALGGAAWSATRRQQQIGRASCRERV